MQTLYVVQKTSLRPLSMILLWVPLTPIPLTVYTRPYNRHDSLTKRPKDLKAILNTNRFDDFINATRKKHISFFMNFKRIRRTPRMLTFNGYNNDELIENIRGLAFALMKLIFQVISGVLE